MNTSNGRKIIYPFDEWQIKETEFNIGTNYRNETIFTTANGYMGMRGNLEEGYSGPENTTFNAVYINGFYEEYDIDYPEGGYGLAQKGQAIVKVVDARMVKLMIDDEPLDLLKGKIRSYERILHMKKGTVERNFTWESPGGRIVDVSIKRMVSLTRPHLAFIFFSVVPVNFDGQLKFISLINGDIQNSRYDKKDVEKDVRVGAGIEGKVFRTIKTVADNTMGFMVQETNRSGFKLACAVEHEISCSLDHSVLTEAKGDMVRVDITVKASKGKCYNLSKYISYYTSRDDVENIEESAINEVSRAKQDGIKVMEDEQKNFLEAFWDDADIVVEGDAAAEQGIRYSLFSLLQSAGRDKKTGIAAKGLTGEGYGGQYFWDTEIYMLPFFIYTRPETAKNLLLQRYRTLDAARARALELGHKGALFPWRTIDGPECSAYFPAGTAQYHINADIVYAIKQYVKATQDQEFLYNFGAEIIFETARFWQDLGSYILLKGNKFCINCVTGPDEYTALVDNNAYTNYMAKMNLEYAVEVAKKIKMERPQLYAALASKIGLKDEEICRWEKAARNMYLPFSEELGIIPQDDSFLYKKKIDIDLIPEDQFPLLLHWHYLNIYRHQLCKQPDVLLLMLLMREKFTPEEIKKNYDYYEPITTHDSSLSPAVFSILAKEIGYDSKAYKYFIQTARMDLDDYNGNTKDGIHAAGMGGTWLAAVFGFGGMKVGDGELCFSPKLPVHWDSMTFKVRYRGRKLLVKVQKSDISFTLMEGDPLKIRCLEEEMFLEKGAMVKKVYISGGHKKCTTAE